MTDDYAATLPVLAYFTFTDVCELLQALASELKQESPTAGECYALVNQWLQEKKHAATVAAAEALLREKRSCGMRFVPLKLNGTLGSK